MTELKARFDKLLATPGDMQLHLERLASYGRQCEHITEFGVRGGVSTTAWLYAQPKVLKCYDINDCSVVTRLRGMSGVTEFHFTQADTTTMPVIEETDLLFIDTLHTYDCLKAELERHGNQARKWIVLHDTETYGEYGERNYQLCTEVMGLWPAVKEFVAQGVFEIEAHHPECWGLTILRRIVH